MVDLECSRDFSQVVCRGNLSSDSRSSDRILRGCQRVPGAVSSVAYCQRCLVARILNPKFPEVFVGIHSSCLDNDFGISGFTAIARNTTLPPIECIHENTLVLSTKCSFESAEYAFGGIDVIISGIVRIAGFAL